MQPRGEKNCGYEGHGAVKPHGQAIFELRFNQWEELDKDGVCMVGGEYQVMEQ